jgi:DNA-binding response OmpR family regulator
MTWAVVRFLDTEELMAHVLVVDDFADLCDMLAEMLLEAGFDVVTASSVDEAKAFLSRCAHGCLILLDLGFPGLPGEALLDWIRLHPIHGSAPVIVMTADSRVRSVAGSAALLKKPLDFSHLSETLRFHYERWTN